jgi:hypothetical protein
VVNTLIAKGKELPLNNSCADNGDLRLNNNISLDARFPAPFAARKGGELC